MYAVLSTEFYVRWNIQGEENNPGLSDENILFAYELMEHNNFLRTVFHSKPSVLSKEEFLEWAKSSNKIFFMLFCADGTPAGLCWLTDPSDTGHQAYAHFSTLGTIKPEKSCEMGKLLIKYIGKVTKVKQLIGITPAVFRHAINFAYSLGFKKLVILDKMLYCWGKERDAVLSICYTYEKENSV